MIRRAALMLTRADEVLVLREIDKERDPKKEGQLRWSDFGGKLENGEAPLDCALRELQEEAQGFLSAEAVKMLQQGLRLTYGNGQREPDIVNLKAPGRAGAQAVAVFRMDCEGVELEP